MNSDSAIAIFKTCGKSKTGLPSAAFGKVVTAAGVQLVSDISVGS